MGKSQWCVSYFVGYIADNCKKLVHIFILKCSRSRMVSLVIYWVQLIQHFVTVIVAVGHGFNQNIHQIQALTKPLCLAQARFYSLPNNE